MEHTQNRMTLFYWALVAVFIVFVLRLFQIQVLRSDFYGSAAQDSQLKQYEVPARRGSLYGYDGDRIVPLVLNESTYRITVDPELITPDKRPEIARQLADILKQPSQDIEEILAQDGRYAIVATKQPKAIKDRVDESELPGVFTNEIIPQRVYVQGGLAPQVLGFVNDAAEGNYGVEQALQKSLAGVPGRVKALTDQNNVPLLATNDNIQQDPVDGADVVLTLDVSMQRQAEKLLERGLTRAKSKSGSVIVMESATGAIKSMANYPAYDPAEFSAVEDPALFVNTSVSSPLEPGSVMKVLTVAAALEEGAVSAEQSYEDPGVYTVDTEPIRNVTHGAGTRTVSDVLELSLNTGATWLLMQLGGGELNEEGRTVWHDYLTERYFFGVPTGIEQGSGSESAGAVPDPVEGFARNITYANTSFGQGVSTTPLQMAAAVNAVINGGTYQQPHLVAGERLSDTAIDIHDHAPRRQDVVSASTSETLRGYMENVVVKNNQAAAREGYRVGGKTGTAEIANPDGGYFSDTFNGTYVGYVGGDVPEYTIFVRVDEPGIPGFAGSSAAAPLFADISNMLIDNFSVPRVSQ